MNLSLKNIFKVTLYISKDSWNSCRTSVHYQKKIYLNCSGRKVPLKISPTATAGTVKQKLKERVGLIPEEIQCEYMGKVLIDGKTLEDQGVPFGANVTCKVKPTVIVQIPSSEK